MPQSIESLDVAGCAHLFHCLDVHYFDFVTGHLPASVKLCALLAGLHLLGHYAGCDSSTLWTDTGRLNKLGGR